MGLLGGGGDEGGGGRGGRGRVGGGLGGGGKDMLSSLLLVFLGGMAVGWLVGWLASMREGGREDSIG